LKAFTTETRRTQRRGRQVKQRKLTPRQLEMVLDVPQPRVSELINGKISRMTADPLAKYLYRLGREVVMTAKMSHTRAAAIV
jgi:predicted XRE-type DNA-binding protein